MLNAARWTVLGLLAASILVLAFAIGELAFIAVALPLLRKNKAR